MTLTIHATAVQDEASDEDKIAALLGGHSGASNKLRLDITDAVSGGLRRAFHSSELVGTFIVL